MSVGINRLSQTLEIDVFSSVTTNFKTLIILKRCDGLVRLTIGKEIVVLEGKDLKKVKEFLK